MGVLKKLEIGSLSSMTGLYWTSSEDDSFMSDDSPSRSGCELPTSAASEHEHFFPIEKRVEEKLQIEQSNIERKNLEVEKRLQVKDKSHIDEKHKEASEGSEPCIFEGRGIASPEIPHPTTPHQRVVRYIPDSPINPRIHSPLPDPYLTPPPTPTTSHQRVFRRLTFDRVLDLSLIQSRTRDSPKSILRFAENGDILSPRSTSSSESTSLASPRPVWQPKLSTPKKPKRNE